MRKFILITAMVLASASTQAGGSRSLTLASNDPPATAEPAKPVEAKAVDKKPAETPKAVDTPAYVARPAVVGTATEASQAETTTPVAERATKTSSAEKPRRRRESTEDRVIRELHRHGIYW
jgi:hypothetical protein